MVNKIRAQRLNGLFPLSYMGVVPVSPQNLVIEDRTPTTADSKNFYLGDFWLKEPSPQSLWVLVALTGNIATWVELFPGAGGGATIFPTDFGVATEAGGVLNIFGDGLNIATHGAGNTVTITSINGGRFLQSLTGNVGGAVLPDAANNIFLLGTAPLTVTGNPLTNTLDISTNGTLATLYVEDVGTATPAGGTLNIIGGIGINTVGSGNTITINATAASTIIFDEDLGSATPLAGHLNVNGGPGIATTGAGNSITISALATVPLLFTEDTGTATAAFNNLNVLGGTGVATVGSGNTITINALGTVPLQFTTDAGVAIPSGNNLNVLGGVGITTSAAGSTITITNTSPGGGNAGQNAFAAYQTGDTLSAPVAAFGVSTINYNLGSAFGANGIMSTLFNNSAAFFGGDGAGLPATFTAPATGTYYFAVTMYPRFGTVSGSPTFRATFTVNTPTALYEPNAITGPQSTLLRSSIVVPLNIGDVVTFTVTITASFPGAYSWVWGTFGARVTVPITPTTYITGYRVT